jgi:hypothetical protein
MAIQIRQVIPPAKTKGGEKQISLNQILRAAYRRFAKDEVTQRAVNRILRRATS